jgi:hypothetical protein
MPSQASIAEVVERLVRDEPRYAPSLRAYCAVARDFEEHGWGTFMARHVHRKLEEWGEPARVTPTPAHLVELGLLERVPQERKAPQYLMPHREEWQPSKPWGWAFLADVALGNPKPRIGSS